MDESIDITELGELTKLDEGGEGVVYRCEDRDGVVFKRYRRPAPGIGASLVALAERVQLLPSPQLAYVQDRTAMPTGLVTENGIVVGFVMRCVPGEFYASSRQGNRFLLELQHLVYAGSPRVQMLVLPEVTMAHRVELLRQWTQVVAVLNGVGVVVGDISERNLLWTLDPEPRVMFLDCDAMRVEGRPDGRRAVQAPDFRDPHVSEALTSASDSYKLALVIARVLTRDFRSDLDARVPPDAARCFDSDRLNELLARTSTDPMRRPAAVEWLDALGGRGLAVDHRELQRIFREALFDGAWDRALAVAATSPAFATRAGVERALAHLAFEQPIEVLLAEVRGSSLHLRLRWPEPAVVDELHVRLDTPHATVSFASTRSADPVADVSIPLDGTDIDTARVSVSPSSSLLRSSGGRPPEVGWRAVALSEIHGAGVPYMS